MHIDLLEAFLCVARTKSVSQASELLFISQPTVTHRIQSLEKAVGERLFVNKNRQMSLTEAGQTLYPYALNMLDNWNSGLEKLRFRSGEPEGKLFVSLFHHASLLYAPKIVSFMETYPKVQLYVKTLVSNDLIQQVLDRKVQFGFVRSARHPRLSYHKMSTGRFLLVMHPGHPLAKRQQIVPSDLRGIPIIVLYNGATDKHIVDQFYREYGTSIEIVMETNNFEVSKQLIATNKAIAFMPQFTAQAELDAGTFVGIPAFFEEEPVLYDIDLVWLTENADLALYRLFIHFFTGRPL